MILHGVDRPRGDLDIVVDATPANVLRLLCAIQLLRSRPYDSAGVRVRIPVRVWRLPADGVRIPVPGETLHIVGPPYVPSYRKLRPHAERLVAEGVTMLLASRLTLIRMKLERSARPRDLEDVQLLRRIVEES
jgi:hypothetical protein